MFLVWYLPLLSPFLGQRDVGMGIQAFVNPQIFPYIVEFFIIQEGIVPFW